MWEKETELATLEQASDDDGRLLHVLSVEMGMHRQMFKREGA